MKHGSLFSGIGGFDLAAQWMGWENVFHCEWMEFPRKVLKHYWPNAESFTDITKSDFTKYANKIDILTGGFPCQPYSTAGKRKGKNDERHLWPHMLRAIQEIKPSFVVGENVRGLTNWNGGMVFDEVCSDLENIGYQIAPFIIPAASVNAPHRRERIWFVAKNTLHSGFIHRESEKERTKIRKQWNTCTRNSDGIYLSEGDASNSNCNGFNECNGNNEKQSSKTRIHAQCDIEQSNVNWNATYTTSTGRTQDNRQGESGFNDQKSEGNNWNNFPTQSPICSGDDGLPTKLDGITFSKWRAESIKGYGNAIVPQVAFEIFKAIELTLHHG